MSLFAMSTQSFGDSCVIVSEIWEKLLSESTYSTLSGQSFGDSCIIVSEIWEKLLSKSTCSTLTETTECTLR